MQLSYILLTVVAVVCVLLTVGSDAKKCLDRCRKKHSGNYAACRRCTEYVTCNNKVMTTTPCPEGDEWNHDTETCQPGPSATCQPVPGDMRYCDPPQSRACVYDCSGKADGDYPSCRKCTEFVSCSNGLLYYMPCPVNLEWDDRQYVRRCEYHPSPTCCLDPTTTTTTSTTQAVPTTETPTTTTQETPVEATTMGDTPTTTASCDPTPFALTATCDNTMALYIDGVLQAAPAGELTDWKTSSTFSMSDCTGLLAISCLDLHVVGGTLASADNGMVTDSTWRCSDTLEAGWELPGFVESPGLWQSATNHGTHGVKPWYMIGGIDPAAKWIWTSDNVTPQGGKTTYCRKKF